jgi:glutamate/tyrosine decarboxylase-like PLP-dependent enzyme
MIITNNQPLALKKACTSAAEYLFLDTEASKYDLGDHTLACGRKADGIHGWLHLKRHGVDGYRKIA